MAGAGSRLELAESGYRQCGRTLNDQGFHFRVHPPELHTSEQGPKSTEDIEALVSVFRNELRQRIHEHRIALSCAGEGSHRN